MKQGGWGTDAELGRHVSDIHLPGGRENIAAFAGFGPREVESEDSDSEPEEVNTSVQIVDRRGRGEEQERERRKEVGEKMKGIRV